MSRQKDHRDSFTGRRTAQCGQRFPSIEIRHVDIEYHEIQRRFPGGFQCLRPSGREQNFEAPDTAEGQLGDLPDQWVIIDKENSFRISSLVHHVSIVAHSLENLSCF